MLANIAMKCLHALVVPPTRNLALQVFEAISPTSSLSQDGYPPVAEYVLVIASLCALGLRGEEAGNGLHEAAQHREEELLQQLRESQLHYSELAREVEVLREDLASKDAIMKGKEDQLARLSAELSHAREEPVAAFNASAEYQSARDANCWAGFKWGFNQLMDKIREGGPVLTPEGIVDCIARINEDFEHLTKVVQGDGNARSTV